MSVCVLYRFRGRAFGVFSLWKEVGNIKKNVISLFVSILLSVTIYALITFEVYVFHLLIPQLHSFCHLLIAIITNAAIQITIISILSTIAIKKFALTIKFAWISAIILFLLFNLYTFPSFYVLLFTGGGEMFGKRFSIPKSDSSFLITSEITLIVLLTFVFEKLKNKLK